MSISKVAGTTFKVAMQGLNVYSGYDQYKSERERGKSPVGAIVKTAAEVALFALCPPAGTAVMAGSLIMGAGEALGAYAQSGGRAAASSVNSVYRNDMSGGFTDTENAATMRQRGLDLIQMSGNNVNGVFGSEARTFYRGMR